MELYIVDELALKLPSLIRECSADQVRFDIASELEGFKSDLVQAAKPGYQSLVLDPAMQKSPISFSDADTLRLQVAYDPVIKESAIDAVEKWESFMPDALAALRFKHRLHPMQKPEPITVPEGKRLNLATVREIFGALPESITLSFVRQWDAYCKRWPSIPQSWKELPMAKFWALADIRKEFEEPAVLGRWYADHPESNVACERNFGIWRTMEWRHALSEESAKSELMAKANTWVVDGLLSQAAEGLPL
jgi:hypothetical protein